MSRMYAVATCRTMTPVMTATRRLSIHAWRPVTRWRCTGSGVTDMVALADCLSVAACAVEVEHGFAALLHRPFRPTARRRLELMPLGRRGHVIHLRSPSLTNHIRAPTRAAPGAKVTCGRANSPATVSANSTERATTPYHFVCAARPTPIVGWEPHVSTAPARARTQASVT